MKQVSRTGILNRGGYQIGGESTGWILETERSGQVEVDVSRVAAKAEVLIGQLVTVIGYFVTEHYIERGPTEILIAENIRKA
jgi:hypothetical protein